jgi:coenzyme F420 hydrogenase subunit delta
MNAEGRAPAAADLGEGDLPEFCRKPTLILGCGNLLFGDDGFGCALVERLQRLDGASDAACLLDVGTGARNVLFTLSMSPSRPRRLLILDAIDAGRPPGELFEIGPEQIPAAKADDFSLHQVPTSNLLLELSERCGVEVRVLACQTAALPEEVRPGLSPPVLEALPRAAEWVAREYLFPARGDAR